MCVYIHEGYKLNELNNEFMFPKNCCAIFILSVYLSGVMLKFSKFLSKITSKGIWVWWDNKQLKFSSKVIA